MPTCKSYDDIAWAISTQIWEDWPELLRTDGDIYNDIGVLLCEEFNDLEWTLFEFLNTGGFNTCFKMKFSNNSGAVIRFPLPGAVMFPEEKVQNEVSTMQYLLEQSSNKIPIPVPSVVRWVKTKESPSDLGPFIIMDYIHHVGSMGDLLEMPGRQAGQPPVLNLDLKPARLEALYRELAKIVLSLSTLSLSRIGSLTKNDSTWEVTRRPLSYSMNEIVQLGTLPRSKLPTMTYQKASSYFEVLAELHLLHLRSQRNEADILADIDIDILADNFRRKFVARFLFRKLVRDQEQRKQWIFHDNGPFPLWCDDFRPENVLVDKSESIAGVVDWEFTYTAPVEFSYAPPWWLLLKKPEDWPGGLDSWCTEYEKALQTFLIAIRKCEDEAIQKKLLGEGQRLSSRMWESWQSGDFWIMYAARNNFAFDAIYWKKIDQRFFGTTPYEDDVCDIWQKRLHLLEPGEKRLIEEYVNLKLKDRNTRCLVWDPDEYTVGWIKRLRIKKEERQEREEER
ncbi:Aminoglycoside phosphotransferase [Penicillium italicum]|uniref:Aminoglycoside phosphotransferase n=1 Tax=Penicillium italicum TaxID=40296 RepID=A0A0A2KQL9_PENIT|nr:Aminoglycoside phosphotransferase [Penicillium italicum]